MAASIIWKHCKYLTFQVDFSSCQQSNEWKNRKKILSVSVFVRACLVTFRMLLKYLYWTVRKLFTFYLNREPAIFTYFPKILFYLAFSACRYISNITAASCNIIFLIYYFTNFFNEIFFSSQSFCTTQNIRIYTILPSLSHISVGHIYFGIKFPLEMQFLDFSVFHKKFTYFHFSRMNLSQ